MAFTTEAINWVYINSILGALLLKLTVGGLVFFLFFFQNSNLNTAKSGLLKFHKEFLKIGEKTKDKANYISIPSCYK